jgi:hypothetical protein
MCAVQHFSFSIYAHRYGQHSVDIMDSSRQVLPSMLEIEILQYAGDVPFKLLVDLSLSPQKHSVPDSCNWTNVSLNCSVMVALC